MDLFHIGFLTVRLVDLIDIALVSFLIYKLYNLLRGGVAIHIFFGILSVYIIYLVFVKALHMHVLGTILGQFMSLGFLTLIIVFQQEIRRFLLVIGSNLAAGNNLIKPILPWKWQADNARLLNITAILKACRQMSINKTGAIIILARNTELTYYINTGDKMDAEVSHRLIESIFFKNSPMHDGAIIIQNNRIKAARCILPITENGELPAHLGMRHRAAIGITEQSDAIAVIVSEETGEIAISEDGEISTRLTMEDLHKKLSEAFTNY
jgi:uncharacterized protein (TIGR00159 family)